MYPVPRIGGCIVAPTWKHTHHLRHPRWTSAPLWIQALFCASIQVLPQVQVTVLELAHELRFHLGRMVKRSLNAPQFQISQHRGPNGLVYPRSKQNGYLRLRSCFLTASNNVWKRRIPLCDPLVRRVTWPIKYLCRHTLANRGSQQSRSVSQFLQRLDLCLPVLLRKLPHEVCAKWGITLYPATPLDHFWILWCENYGLGWSSFWNHSAPLRSYVSHMMALNTPL